MRRYHIYFEPFVDKIRVNQYIGLDMSFYSDLLPVESLIYILDTVIIDELTFRNNKRWKEDLQKELGIENIQLNFFDAPKGYMKDGSYEDCEHVRTIKQNETCPDNEVRLCVFTQSAKPCNLIGITKFLLILIMVKKNFVEKLSQLIHANQNQFAANIITTCMENILQRNPA